MLKFWVARPVVLSCLVALNTPLVDSKSSESPIQTAAGAASPEATEAFSMLGNETRLSILLGLWEAFKPFAEENALSFSELRERVGMPDSGQFNYHLNKLTDHFIRETESGYEIRDSGQKFVRTVIAGTGLENESVRPADLDLACNRCGSALVKISYNEETLYLTCPSCEGFATSDKFPPGTLAIWPLAPAGLAHREPAELLVAAAVTANNRLRMKMEGVCPDCSGTIDTSLKSCEDHRPSNEDVCANCGNRDSVRVRYVCSVCKSPNSVPVQTAVHDHPAVVSFYWDHDVDITYPTDDPSGFYQIWGYFWKQTHTLVSTDSVRIRVTVPCEGDELRLLLDEDLNVIEVSDE